MTTVNRSLKVRTKVAPDRLQENVSNARVIRNRQIEVNDMLHLAEADDLEISELPVGAISTPMEFWQQHKSALLERGGLIAVQIASDQNCEDLIDDLNDIDMVVLPFVNFVDGRAYSNAQLLRSRYSYQGEIRAIGDVHFDQLGFLERCGCNAFELPESDNQEAALAAFDEFSEVYQPASDGGSLIFARRRAVH